MSNEEMANNDAQSRLKGFIIGAIGSLAGLMAMRFYWQKIAPQVQQKVNLGGTDAYPDEIDLDDISQVERQPDPEESSTAVVGSTLYEQAIGAPPPTDETREQLSYLTHWGYGLLQGGLYGAARAGDASTRGLDWRGGAAHAIGLWLMGDETAVPMLGLQQGPTAVSPASHLNRLGAHLAYGLATAAAAQILRRLL